MDAWIKRGHSFATKFNNFQTSVLGWWITTITTSSEQIGHLDICQIYSCHQNGTCQIIDLSYGSWWSGRWKWRKNICESQSTGSVGSTTLSYESYPIMKEAHSISHPIPTLSETTKFHNHIWFTCSSPKSMIHSIEAFYWIINRWH